MGDSALVDKHNHRVFPRMDLHCPISYRDEIHINWALSSLIDFSADGLLLVTDQPLRTDQSITIQLRPDKKRLLRGTGSVARCVDKGNSTFHVAIKDIHWQPVGTNNEQSRHKYKSFTEKRAFPRFQAECPVRYNDAETQEWLIGRMLDFSATGLMMVTDRCLDVGTHINLHVEPGRKKYIPALGGVGLVVRTKFISKNRYVVGIKMLSVKH